MDLLDRRVKENENDRKLIYVSHLLRRLMSNRTHGGGDGGGGDDEDTGAVHCTYRYDQNTIKDIPTTTQKGN